jgi:uncharacterized protein (UPF0332 family)
VVKYWWEKANESLQSAKREFDAGSYHFAINRIYYTAYYAVSALLLKNQLSFKKHTGVRSAFHQEFIKANIVDSQWGKAYDRFFEDRQEGDYVEVIDFEKEYVGGQIHVCEKFIEVLKPLIIEEI